MKINVLYTKKDDGDIDMLDACSSLEIAMERRREIAEKEGLRIDEIKIYAIPLDGKAVLPAISSRFNTIRKNLICLNGLIDQEIEYLMSKSWHMTNIEKDDVVGLTLASCADRLIDMMDKYNEGK
jgi:hypothetical protein